MKWCTYKTYHPVQGFYYFGKTIIRKSEGGYKGSGGRLKFAFTLFPKFEWKTDIVQKFETEQEAFDHEAILVTYKTLMDPKCLNQHLGGGTAPFRQGRLGQKHTEEAKHKMSIARIAYGAHQPESYAKGIARKVERNNQNGGRPLGHIVTEETREKIRQNRLGTTRSDETKLKMKEQALNRSKVECPHCHILFGKGHLTQHLNANTCGWV